VLVVVGGLFCVMGVVFMVLVMVFMVLVVLLVVVVLLVMLRIVLPVVSMPLFVGVMVMMRLLAMMTFMDMTLDMTVAPPRHFRHVLGPWLSLGIRRGRVLVRGRVRGRRLRVRWEML
jgi:hypothetical protein